MVAPTALGPPSRDPVRARGRLRVVTADGPDPVPQHRFRVERGRPDQESSATTVGAVDDDGLVAPQLNSTLVGRSAVLAQLTELTDEQAAYIGVPKQGPFKPDTYRY